VRSLATSRPSPAAASGGRCRLCDGDAAPAFTARDRNRRISDDPFAYVACPSCGTLSLTKPPADLGRFYPPDYYGVPASADAAVARDPNARHRLELVRRLVPSGRLVEVGPSMGAFLELAKRAGYDASGIELDGDCCRFIEQVLHLPVTQSDDPASALDGPYDAIVGWHVFEHLAEPARFLAAAAAAAALAPGGTLILIAPNPASLQRRLLGRRWVHVDAPRHLALMPLDAVAREGARHGLEVVHATTDDHDAHRSNAFGWCESFAGSTQDERLRRWLRLGGEAVNAAVAPIERRGGRGASWTLALRRPR